MNQLHLSKVHRQIHLIIHLLFHHFVNLNISTSRCHLFCHEEIRLLEFSKNRLHLRRFLQIPCHNQLLSEVIFSLFAFFFICGDLRHWYVIVTMKLIVQRSENVTQSKKFFFFFNPVSRFLMSMLKTKFIQLIIHLLVVSCSFVHV